MPRRLALVAVALIAASCASDASGDDAPASPDVELECEAEGYPCSFAEVPEEILERSDAIGDEAVAMFEGGASSADVETWLSDQEGMAEVESDDDAVRFRLDGGRGTWIFRESAFATRSSPGTSAAATNRRPPPALSLHHVAGPEQDAKRAVVLSPMLWEFGAEDDGPMVAATLAATRGYEGRVSFAANETASASNVTVDSFTGWDDAQVVHVVSHGIRICRNGSCRATIAASTVEAEAPEGPGVFSTADILKRLDELGLEVAKVEGTRGLELKIELVLLSADFFRAEYGGGLEDTFIFFNACETFGGQATDLADAIRGTTSVFLGWDETVNSPEAFATAAALYEDLAAAGYPVGVAYERLGALQSDCCGATLQMGTRADGDDLRIRDVVELIDPGSDVPLSAASSVPIVGEGGDGEPDAAPYAVRVDGMTAELAPNVVLHVSANGEETDPQPITTGAADERDSWLIQGEIPLGIDVEDDTVVTFRAWVELHDGGESDDETTATVTSAVPIMGYEWVMEATSTTGHTDSGHELETFATLTLEFEEGQDLDEPKPRYVVTGGTVRYGNRNTVDNYGCSFSGPSPTFEVTPEMSPPEAIGDKPASVLVFDTTVTPVEYYGVIWVGDLGDDVVSQLCPEMDEAGTVSYGSNELFMLVESDRHYTVADLRSIENPPIGARNDGYHDMEYTITRVR